MKAMKVIQTAALTALLGMAGCGSNGVQQNADNSGGRPSIAGDSTLYGLACEGCNDTVIVFLRMPYDGSNPDTLNILEASRLHRVLGKPMIGDELAIVRHQSDSTIADLVIVTEDLLAEWCYIVLPEVRKRADMEGPLPSELADTLKKLLLMEREYGLNIKSEGAVLPIGYQYRRNAADGESLVEYPPIPRYFEWHIFNGKMVFQSHSTDSTGQSNLLVSDTAIIERLSADTLVLQFRDHTQGYYKRIEEEQPQ